MANTETKTTNTKTETSTPNATFASFDPMGIWTQGQQAWTTMINESMTRWQSFADQFASVEAQVQSHAQTAVTQWSQLAKDAIAYGAQLTAEARKLSVEMPRRCGVSTA